MSLAESDIRATIDTLRLNLLAHPSATRTLEDWCRAYKLADPPIVRAVVKSDRAACGVAAAYPELRVGDADTVRLRRVLLTCGTRVLSEASNCYVPSRLTADMNRLLEHTDLPFGKAVSELDFERHTLSSRMLWRSQESGVPPECLFENRAVLTCDAGRLPIASLIETYRKGVLPTS